MDLILLVMTLVVGFAIAPIASASPVTIAVTGQSNARGYAAPFPCTTIDADPDCASIPPGTRIIRNGAELSEFDARFSGVEVALSECLVSLGYQPTIVIRAINGILLSSLVTGQIPALVSDLEALDSPPATVVLIHGEADARTWGNAVNYWGRVGGPAYDDGTFSGHPDPTTGEWSRPVDISLLGQLRRNWPNLPIIVTAIRTRDGRDLGAFHLGDEVNGAGAATYPYHDLVRAAQSWGCAHEPGCMLVETETYETSVGSDLHYSSAGFWALGWDLCAVVDRWALQSFPPAPEPVCPDGVPTYEGAQ